MEESLKKFRKLPQVKEVRQKGLMVGIEMGPYPPEERRGHQLCLNVRKKGLLIRPLGNIIVLMPPLSITKEEIGWMTNIVYEEIQRCQAPIEAYEK